jgi:hypothetical protein
VGEIDLTRTGSPLRKRIAVNGVLALKGLFTLPAANDTAEVVYALRGQYKTFHTMVGIDDAIPSIRASLYFTVMCDGQPRWRSMAVRKKATNKAVNWTFEASRPWSCWFIATAPMATPSWAGMC